MSTEEKKSQIINDDIPDLVSSEEIPPQVRDLHAYMREHLAEAPHVHGEHCNHVHHNIRRVKVGRNDACPCGSGKKFKKCHLGMKK